jgi:probable F420-dependent oxidoreductase
VVFGERLEEYGRPENGGILGGRQPTDSDGAWLEPLAVLTAVAAVTSRIGLSTGILLAALRRPVVLAKQLSTLDVLSEGRLDVGVGVGWQREEYEAAGLEFTKRGRLLDHSLEVCQVLWRERAANYESDELNFHRIHQMPKPVHPGGIPIWISGTANPAVFRRLARFGAGWILWGSAVSDPSGAVAAMRTALTESSHPDPAGIGVSCPLPVRRDQLGHLDPAATMEPVSQMLESGVTDFRIGIDSRGSFDQLFEVYQTLTDAYRRAIA